MKPLVQTKTPGEHTNLVSRVWWLQGLGNTPGHLRIRDGRVRLSTAQGTVFDASVEDLHVTQPWWWFGGGLRFIVDGTTYKVSFVRPNGEAHLAARVGNKALGTAAGPLVIGHVAAVWEDITRGQRGVVAWTERLAAHGCL